MTNTNEQELKMKEVAGKIEAILTESGYALQPFIAYSEFGTVPRVRLVDVSKTNEQTTDTTEADGDSDTDNATESSDTQDS